MNTTFRRARFRGQDLFPLLGLRYPVRCARCGQLQKKSIFVAMKAAAPTPKEGQQVGSLEPFSRAPVSGEYAAKLQDVALVDSRATIPLQTLLDPLDLRCQYCPGQAFRRSKLRALDLLLLARMRYPARCLRCGQRQIVSFIAAATGVPSHFKQARMVRHDKNSWQGWTQNSMPGTGIPEEAGWLPPNPVEMVLPSPSPRRAGLSAAAPLARPVAPAPMPSGPVSGPESVPPAKKSKDDQAIW